MKALLTAVRARLDAQLVYTPKMKIIVVHDPDWPLEGVPRPHVTLADRGLTRDYDSDSRIEILTVRVTAYQEVLKEEASVMGVGATKGVLDILSDIETALWQWLPSDSYHDAQILAQSPIEVVVAEDEFSARKSMDVVYKRQIVGE